MAPIEVETAIRLPNAVPSAARRKPRYRAAVFDVGVDQLDILLDQLWRPLAHVSSTIDDIAQNG